MLLPLLHMATALVANMPPGRPCGLACHYLQPHHIGLARKHLPSVQLGVHGAVRQSTASISMSGVWEAREKLTSQTLQKIDRSLLDKALRIFNHVPTLASISYFGLIAMTQMMAAQPSMMATFKAVITRAVGPTSNAQFSQVFSTLVTPANFVFLIWPVIGILQLTAVLFSALRPGPPLRQIELSALSLANICATAWLIVSSNAFAGALPLASCLVLPLVPLVSGFPLRAGFAAPSGLYNAVYQVFSSFTTLASFLALTVELQYGGRVPFFAGQAELCALVFTGLTAAVVSLPERAPLKKAVNVLALTGIVSKRITSGTASLISPSFIALVTCLFWAAKKAIKDKTRSPDANGYLTF